MDIILALYASILALAIWQEKKGVTEVNGAEREC